MSSENQHIVDIIIMVSHVLVASWHIKNEKKKIAIDIKKMHVKVTPV